MIKSKLHISFLLGFVFVFLFGFSVFAVPVEDDTKSFYSLISDPSNIVFDGSYSAVNNTSSVASFIGSYYDGWNSYYSSDGSNWQAPNYNIGGLQYRTDIYEYASDQRHNVIRWQSVHGRSSADSWDGKDDWGKVTTPGYGKYCEVFCFEWINVNTYRSDPEYGNIVFYDCDGKQFAQLSLDVNGSSLHWGADNWYSIVSGSVFRVYVVNNFDTNTYNVYYFFDSPNMGGYHGLMYYSLYNDGLVNGFGSFTLQRGKYNIAWAGTMGLGDVKIYARNYQGAFIFESSSGSSGNVSSLSGWLSCMITGGMKCFTDMLEGVELFDGISLLYVIVALIAMNILITFLWSRFKGASIGSTSTKYISPSKDDNKK